MLERDGSISNIPAIVILGPLTAESEEVRPRLHMLGDSAKMVDFLQAVNRGVDAFGARLELEREV